MMSRLRFSHPCPPSFSPVLEWHAGQGHACLQPITYEEAMASDHAAHWQAAMDEMASLEDLPLQTWVLEDLPAHVSAIPVRWECTRKTEAFHLRARWNASRRGW